MGIEVDQTKFILKIFNLPAKNCPQSSSEAYKYHESVKKNKYGQCKTEYEKATFCPLVFASISGAGTSVSKVLKLLAFKSSAQKRADTLISCHI